MIWNEILYLLMNCEGRVLDIACGTGQVMKILLSNNENLDVHGFYGPIF